MRFMMMIKADPNYEAGIPPRRELIEAVGKMSEELKQKGVFLTGGGLLPSSKGARIRAGRGKVTVIDGPFTEAKELIGGFSIMEIESLPAAVEIAKNFMRLHIEILGPGYEGQCEVRPMFDPGECGSVQH